LNTINPNSSCQTDVNKLIQDINNKLRADEKARWDFKIKQYNDKVAAEKEQLRVAEEKSKRDDSYRENQSVRNHELDKIRVNAYREVALEQAKNQPRAITYNNIIWK